MENATFEQNKPSKIKKALKSLLFFLPLVALIGLIGSGKVNLGPQGSESGQDTNNAQNNNQSNNRGGRGNRNGNNKDQKEILIPVETSFPTTNTLYSFYNGTASLYAENNTQIAAKIGGQVTQVLVEEGDFIKTGQVVAKLESARFRLEVERAQANLNKITQEIERKQDLYEQKLIPRDSFESLKYDKDSAEVALSIAKLDLSYATVRSPISGVVSKRNIQVGNAITTNQALYEVTNLKSLQADMFIPEREMNNLRKNQMAQVKFDALELPTKASTINAKVKRISPVIDSKTGTFKVTLEIDNSSGLLKPGMFGRFNVIYGEHKDVMTVPRSAIQDVDGEQSVYTILNDKAVKVVITTGYENAGNTEVSSGLSNEQAVVTLGQAGLRVGSKVLVSEGPNPRTPEYQVELDKKAAEKAKEEAKDSGEKNADAANKDSGA